MYPGESRELDFELLDATGAPYVVPENVAMDWILAETSHDTPILTKSLVNGDIIIEDSTAIIALEQRDTIALKPGGRYFHRLAVTDLDNNDIYIAATGCLALGRVQVPLATTTTLKAQLAPGTELSVDAIIV